MTESGFAEPDDFELVLTRFAPRPVTQTFQIKTVAELDTNLLEVGGEDLLCIGLGCIAEGADWGSFWLLLNGTRAYIHLLEGPCLTARDPSEVVRDGEVIQFPDDGGNWHEVAAANTVSRELGLRAVRHWLPRGEKLPELSWGRA